MKSHWLQTIRVTTFILFAIHPPTKGNPLPLPSDAQARLYISGEQLTAYVSPDAAELRGIFQFQYRQDVIAPGRRSSVILDIPIWFPEVQPNDSAVAEFWKTFPKDDMSDITPLTRKVFDKAVEFRAFLNNEVLSVNQFSVLTCTNSRQRWAPREWQQEAGFCCLVLSLYVLDDTALTQKQLIVTYRQPLLQTNQMGEFFYLPEFQNLPKEISTTDTNRYSITIVARPACSLSVSSGDQKWQIEAGHRITISPRHHQAIRIIATRRSN